MKPIQYGCLLLALCGLGGCGSLVQDVSFDNIPTAQPRLVVQSFISPQDTALAVYVDAPTSILGLYTNDNVGGFGFSNRFPIQNATVEVSDGTRSVRLSPRNAATQPNTISTDLYYGISTRLFPVVAGRTYTLTVSAPGYPPASARCTIPAAVPTTELRIDSTERQQGFGSGRRYTARLGWRDPAGVANYYRVVGSQTFDVRYTIGQGATRRDTVVKQEATSFPRDGASRLLTDQNRDGQALQSPVFESFTNFYFGPDASGSPINLVVRMMLSNCEPAMYRFLEGVERQRNQGDNPFAEPVLIPSNISGGLGCFGGYNQASLSVRMR
jgi:hypothetical protein